MLKKTFMLILNFFCEILVLFYLAKKKLGFNYKHIAQDLGQFTGVFGELIRRKFYIKTLNKCGNDIRVMHGAYICYETTEIGARCTIEDNTVISNCAIGDNVIIAANVSVMSGANHHEVDNLEITFYDTNNESMQLIIGSNIWIGTRSVIMGDIPSGCVIGAGAVVTKSFQEENSIIAGVPAKLIRARGV